MNATLRDVAERSGLSKSLVSLALRGDDGVTTERRANAVAAADELGYSVSTLARRRAAGSRLAIAALVTECANPFHAEVVASMLRAAATLGFELDVVDGRRDPDVLVDALKALVASAAEPDGPVGIAVVSSWLPPSALRAAGRAVPVAVVGSAGDDLRRIGVDTVRSAEEAGMRDLVLHLASLGHQRICFVEESSRASTTRREKGFRQTIDSLLGPEAGRIAAIAAVERDPHLLEDLLDDGVSAFVGANDATAARLLAGGRGTSLLDRSVVAGFDDTALAGRMSLTSVGQPRKPMGARAVELVVRRLRGSRIERHEVLPTTLVTRDSTLRGAQSASVAR